MAISRQPSKEVSAQFKAKIECSDSQLFIKVAPSYSKVAPLLQNKFNELGTLFKAFNSQVNSTQRCSSSIFNSHFLRTNLHKEVTDLTKIITEFNEHQKAVLNSPEGDYRIPLLELKNLIKLINAIDIAPEVIETLSHQDIQLLNTLSTMKAQLKDITIRMQLISAFGQTSVSSPGIRRILFTNSFGAETLIAAGNDANAGLMDEINGNFKKLQQLTLDGIDVTTQLKSKIEHKHFTAHKKLIESKTKLNTSRIKLQSEITRLEIDLDDIQAILTPKTKQQKRADRTAVEHALALREPVLDLDDSSDVELSEVTVNEATVLVNPQSQLGEASPAATSLDVADLSAVSEGDIPKVHTLKDKVLSHALTLKRKHDIENTLEQKHQQLRQIKAQIITHTQKIRASENQLLDLNETIEYLETLPKAEEDASPMSSSEKLIKMKKTLHELIGQLNKLHPSGLQGLVISKNTALKELIALLEKTDENIDIASFIEPLNPVIKDHIFSTPKDYLIEISYLTSVADRSEKPFKVRKDAAYDYINTLHQLIELKDKGLTFLPEYEALKKSPALKIDKTIKTALITYDDDGFIEACEIQLANFTENTARSLNITLEKLLNPTEAAATAANEEFAPKPLQEFAPMPLRYTSPNSDATAAVIAQTDEFDPMPFQHTSANFAPMPLRYTSPNSDATAAVIAKTDEFDPKPLYTPSQEFATMPLRSTSPHFIADSVIPAALEDQLATARRAKQSEEIATLLNDD